MGKRKMLTDCDDQDDDDCNDGVLTALYSSMFLLYCLHTCYSV